jgi:hypothetical protein
MAVDHAEPESLPDRGVALTLQQGKRYESAEVKGPRRQAGGKASLIAGIAVVVQPLGARAETPSFDIREAASGSAWRRNASTARRRIDGWPKVTGAKLYAADFRADDMPAWPNPTAHAMLLKTTDATHVFEGIDLTMLDRELSPDRVVLTEDLSRPGLPCRTSMPVIFSVLPARPRPISASPLLS